MASKERFSSVTEEELQQIKIDSRAESTVKATKFWSSLFEDYLREKNIAIDLEVFGRASTGIFGSRPSREQT